MDKRQYFKRDTLLQTPVRSQVMKQCSCVAPFQFQAPINIHARHKITIIFVQKRQQCKDKTTSSARSSPTRTTSTCGMTTWTWTDSWRRCVAGVRGTTEPPRGQRRKQQPLGVASRPHLGVRTPRARLRPVQSAACRTSAATGPPRTSVASASRTGNLQRCTGHTSSDQRTGKSPVPSSGTTPVPSVKPPGTKLTHSATVRSRNGMELPTTWQGSSSGSFDERRLKLENTVHNSHENVLDTSSCLYSFSCCRFDLTNRVCTSFCCCMLCSELPYC